MIYQIEMVKEQYVYFTIDLELLEFLKSDEGISKLIPVGLFSLHFPTYILRNNRLHERHWTVGRRFKNTKILGREFQMTGINLESDNSNVSEFNFVYSYY